MTKETTAPAKAVQKQKITMDPKYISRLTVTLLGICTVVALLLGVVNYVTDPIITQIQQEKTNAAMNQVLPAKNYVPIESGAEKILKMYEAYNDGKVIGYVMEVSSNGFGGAVKMVVGVDAATMTVTGVAVTDHGETANVGTKVVGNQSILDRFVGMSHADGEITVNSGANRFDGVTGATVSSKAVTAGVNAALQAAAARRNG